LVPAQLEWVGVQLETDYGLAASSWKKVGDKVEMDVVVPPNTTATIEFPNARKSETVPAGSYHYELEISE